MMSKQIPIRAQKWGRLIFREANIEWMDAVRSNPVGTIAPSPMTAHMQTVQSQNQTQQLTSASNNFSLTPTGLTPNPQQTAPAHNPTLEEQIATLTALVMKQNEEINFLSHQQPVMNAISLGQTPANFGKTNPKFTMDGIYDAGVATQLEPNVFHVNMVSRALNLEQYANSYNYMNLDQAQLHERKFMHGIPR